MRYHKSLGSRRNKKVVSLMLVLITAATISGVLGQNQAHSQKAIPAQQTYAGVLGQHQAHSQKAIPAQQTNAKNFDVILTLYGINGTTGNVFAFVKAHNMIKNTLINATKLDISDNNTDGIGQTGFSFANLTLNPGEPYTTCVVILKDVKMICSTDYKTPFPRPQFVDISIR